MQGDGDDFVDPCFGTPVSIGIKEKASHGRRQLQPSGVLQTVDGLSQGSLIKARGAGAAIPWRIPQAAAAGVPGIGPAGERNTAHGAHRFPGGSESGGTSSAYLPGHHGRGTPCAGIPAPVALPAGGNAPGHLGDVPAADGAAPGKQQVEGAAQQRCFGKQPGRCPASPSQLPPACSFSEMMRANSEHLTSVAPSICRARS